MTDFAFNMEGLQVALLDQAVALRPEDNFGGRLGRVRGDFLQQPVERFARRAPVPAAPIPAIRKRDDFKQLLDGVMEKLVRDHRALAQDENWREILDNPIEGQDEKLLRDMISAQGREYIEYQLRDMGFRFGDKGAIVLQDTCLAELRVINEQLVSIEQDVDKTIREIPTAEDQEEILATCCNIRDFTNNDGTATSVLVRARNQYEREFKRNYALKCACDYALLKKSPHWVILQTLFDILYGGVVA